MAFMRVSRRRQRRQNADVGSAETTNTDFWMNLTVAVLSTVLVTQTAQMPLDIGGRADAEASTATPPVIIELSENSVGEPTLTLLPEDQHLPDADAIAALIEARRDSASGFAITTSADTSAEAIQWALIALHDAGASQVKLGVRTNNGG